MKLTRSNLLIGVAVAVVAAAPIQAKSKPRWSVINRADPITGDQSCVVAAYDQLGRSSFSRVGYLYPMVEVHSKLGLLVGVSTGGQYRIPAGDILWRVDDRPFRELKATDNPVVRPITLPRVKMDVPADVQARTEAVMESAARQATAMTASSTVASGEKAREMLDEMLAGRTLIYRAAAAAPEYGLPSSKSYRVGQFTNDGHKPFPIDDSFRRGLAQCGVSTVPRPQAEPANTGASVSPTTSPSSPAPAVRAAKPGIVCVTC